jgi:hypothetical protein
MMKNHWVSSRDEEYACWCVRFPKEQMTNDWEIFEFMKGVYECGEAEGIYRVVRTEEPNAGDSGITYVECYENGVLQGVNRIVRTDEPQPHAYRADSGISYVEYLEKVLHETGKYVGFRQQSTSIRQDKEGFLATARLSYFETDGTIVEAEVEDLGKLLMRLRPDQLDMERYDMAPSLPMSLWGIKGGWYKDGRPYETYVGICLQTDIWFPWIYGFPGEAKRWHDNTDLALRHTPRLNRFLARVKELTLQFGGKWERSNDQHISIYWPMIGEEGILLDAEVEWDDWENWGKK